MELNKQELEFLQESNLIESEQSGEALADAVEAWDFAKANRESMTVEIIQYTHKLLMTRHNDSIAGNLRHYQRVWIGSRECKAEDRRNLQIKLDNWLEAHYSSDDWQGSHVFFEKIHPFLDGNGRVGRILMNCQRLNLGLPILTIHAGQEQMEYYTWF